MGPLDVFDARRLKISMMRSERKLTSLKSTLLDGLMEPEELQIVEEEARMPTTIRTVYISQIYVYTCFRQLNSIACIHYLQSRELYAYPYPSSFKPICMHGAWPNRNIDVRKFDRPKAHKAC